MKRAAFILFVLIDFHISFSQKETTFILSLEGVETNEKIAVPFHFIKIIDARFDQKNIGCVVKSFSFKAVTEEKLLAFLPENLSTYLPKILPGIVALDKNSVDTLVILVKQFRIADHISITYDVPHGPESLLTISCSFYKADGNQLVKISSLDEVLADKWLTDKNPVKETIPSFRAQSVARLLSRVFQGRIWTPTQQSFTVSEVNAGIQKRLQLPVFTDAVLVAGLYKNFDEFKRNAPGYLDFQIGRDMYGFIKEVRDTNATILDAKDFWGLCDGRDQYVFFQGGLHKLYRVDKSFRFLFYRRFSEGEYKSNLGAPMNGFFGERPMRLATPQFDNAANDVRQEYLYLNMETGGVHVEEVIGTAPLRKLRGRSE